ncbi:MAG: hypothetical protein FJ215_03975 [Ignavibacteria bacterium]|nr:hypothetical protein [Ignavibacteria bacterium]
MSYNSGKTLACALFLIVGACSLDPQRVLLAQPRSSLGGQPAPAFRFGFGAIGPGMGNAVSALPSSASAGYYNPALTAFLDHPYASATLGLLTLDRNLNFVGYARRLPPKAGISFGVINAGVGDIQGRDRDGRPTEIYSTSENAFVFSFGLKPNEWMAIGLSPKIFYYSLYEDVSSTTVGFDVGVMMRLHPQWSVGAVIHDISSKYRWDTSPLYGNSGNSMTDRFPLRRKLSLGYEHAQIGLMAGAEFEYIGSLPIVRLGANMTLAEQFQIRAGIDQLTWKENLLPRISLGFSFESSYETWRPGISYAFVHDPYGSGGMHFVSLSVRFE